MNDTARDTAESGPNPNNPIDFLGLAQALAGDEGVFTPDQAATLKGIIDLIGHAIVVSARNH